MSRASKHVFAFEPNPYPLGNLKSLVDKNVTILPIALGNSDGPIKLKFLIMKMVGLQMVPLFHQEVKNQESLLKYNVENLIV